MRPDLHIRLNYKTAKKLLAALEKGVYDKLTPAEADAISEFCFDFRCQGRRCEEGRLMLSRHPRWLKVCAVIGIIAGIAGAIEGISERNWPLFVNALASAAWASIVLVKELD